MKLHILIFEIGLSNGYRQLLGIYDSKGEADEATKKHMAKYFFSEQCYKVYVIDLNKEVDITIADW